MLASTLDEYVTFYKKTTVRDDFGEAKETFTPYKKVKAKITYKTTTEKEVNQQLTALRIIKIQIRFRLDIDETMQIELWGDRFDIRYIEHLKRTSTFITAERGKL